MKQCCVTRQNGTLAKWLGAKQTTSYHCFPRALKLLKRRHDTQHNDTMKNDALHNHTQHNYAQGCLILRQRCSTVHLLVFAELRSAPFCIEIILYLSYKTSYLNEEVNCTKPFPSGRVPFYIASLKRIKESTIILIVMLNLITLIVMLDVNILSHYVKYFSN